MKLRTCHIQITTTLFIIMFSISPNVHCQIGFRLGFNLAGQDYGVESEDLSFKRIFGIGAGVFYPIKINKYLWIQTEMNFVQHGVRIVVTENNMLFRSKKGSYIQLPLLLTCGTSKKKGSNFYIQAGPYIGIGLWYMKKKLCFGTNCEVYRERFGDADAPDKIDLGLYLGAGMSFTKNYSVDARYILGLKDTGDSGGFYSIKNNGIFLTFGYSLKS